MIRVLSLTFSGVFGGSHNCNARCIPPLEAEGIHAIVVVPDEAGDAASRLHARGISVLQIPMHRLRGTLRPSAHVAFALCFWGEVAAIRKIIQEHKIDLVQINGLVNPHGAVAARLEGIPVVWEIGETAPVLLRHLMMPVVLKLADVLMITGSKLAHRYPGATRLGDRLIPFFPPVDVEEFRPEPAVRRRARAELGLNASDVVIGNVGNLNPDKGHGMFIRAAAALRRSGPDARFVILGSTYNHRLKYAARLRREATALGLEPEKQLIIRDPRTRVSTLAQAFDIFWLTSRSEGAPTVVEEAMALKLPVIATDVGSVREVLGEEQTGLVTPPMDPEAMVRATLRLLADPETRVRMGEAGRRRAIEHFAVNVCVQTQVRAFDAAIAHWRAVNRKAASSLERSPEGRNLISPR